MSIVVDALLARHDFETAQEDLGIKKSVGWHTFRRRSRGCSRANAEDVKVTQELMRHANPHTTPALTRKPVLNTCEKRKEKWWK